MKSVKVVRQEHDEGRREFSVELPDGDLMCMMVGDTLELKE